MVRRHALLLAPVLLCAACSAAAAPNVDAASGSATPRTATTSAAVAPTSPVASAPEVTVPGTSVRGVADVGEFGGLPPSRPTNAAGRAVAAISLAIPHSGYGGVTLGGGNGIIVAELFGHPDAALDRELRRARASGVIVEIREVTRSLASLEALADHGLWAGLPEHLRAHLVEQQVDLVGNRVVAGFDVPIDVPLRTTVGSRFGDAVAVAPATPNIGLVATASLD